MLVHLFMRVVPLQILVKAVPIKQGHTLRILFPITPNVRRYKEGPCRYISHLIGHEGEGSLFYILKKLGKLSFCGLCCSLGTLLHARRGKRRVFAWAFELGYLRVCLF
jgi:secreted Zn-dependent insulinase-like peptidase